MLQTVPDCLQLLCWSKALAEQGLQKNNLEAKGRLSLQQGIESVNLATRSRKTVSQVYTTSINDVGAVRHRLFGCVRWPGLL